MKTPHIIEAGKFESGQLLQIRTINGTYRINKATERAVLIECSNGKWLDNRGFIPVWLPISQLSIIGVNSNHDNSQHGVHIVDIPEWLVNANSKKW